MDLKNYSFIDEIAFISLDWFEISLTNRFIENHNYTYSVRIFFVRAISVMTILS